jgi:PTH2 family peptidyl-tRNA hydrolase
MVIIVRNDLGMSVGKIASQVGHAVLGLYKVASVEAPQNVDQWEMTSWPKIVLQVDSEEEMDELR